MSSVTRQKSTACLFMCVEGKREEQGWSMELNREFRKVEGKMSPDAPSSSLSQVQWEPSGPSHRRWPLTFAVWLGLHCKFKNNSVSVREPSRAPKEHRRKEHREARTVNPSPRWPCDWHTRSSPPPGQQLQAGRPQSFHPGNSCGRPWASSVP